MAILVSASVGCNDTTPTGPVISVTRAVAMTMDAAGQVHYEASCVLNLREFGTPTVDALGYSRSLVEGLGECGTTPFGKASVRFEGFAREREEELTIEGTYVYRFADGSQLFSRAKMEKRPVSTFMQAVAMYVEQNIVRGTGRLAGVRGGSMNGYGKMYEPSYRATYFAQGSITFNDVATQD